MSDTITPIGVVSDGDESAIDALKVYASRHGYRCTCDLGVSCRARCCGCDPRIDPDLCEECDTCDRWEAR